MADNITLSANVGSGAVVAADDVSSVYYQLIQLVTGTDGGAKTLVTGSNGLPVALQASTNTTEVVGDAAHDAAAAGNPVLVAAYASAAAPSDVSGDGDATRLWCLRNGSPVVNVAAGGTLVTATSTSLNVNVTNSVAVTNAGTFAVQVSSLPASTNTIEVVGDVAHDAAAAGNPVLIAGYASAAAPSDVSGDADAARLWCLRNGSQVVNVAAGGTLITATSTSLNVNVTNASLTVASHAVTNAGTFAVQVDGSALTALQLIDDVVFVDDAAFTPATSKVAVIGAQADEASTDSVDEGDAGALRMTLDRKLYVVQGAHTAGGCSIFRSIDIDETEEDVKTSAGQVYGVHCMNMTTAPLFLKFYNATAANVTVGSTAPVMTLPVAGNNDSDGAGFYFTVPCGIVFDTAICVACTTAVADADTGAPAANACIVQVFYK